MWPVAARYNAAVVEQPNMEHHRTSLTLTTTMSDEEQKQCRICLDGVDAEEELGRLIRPCLCRGTISVTMGLIILLLATYISIS